MAECQNFFDETSPSGCRSSSSTEPSSLAAATSITSDECDDHRLELCLGPSVNARKPKQHDMVRPIPLYPSLDKQRSGNFANATDNSPLFGGHSDVSMADKALFSKDSAFSTPPRISREQVWQTLQKTDAVLGPDASTSKAFCDDAATSLWGRRATSMQIITPSSDMSEVEACHIRRACSTEVPQELLSRQSSIGQEGLVDESPDPPNLLSYNQPHEALELLRKREMQAHRRLEARKRRRLLVEGKQQKKARQNCGLNNRQCFLPVEKVSHVRKCPVDRNCSLEPHHKAHHHEVLPAKLGDNEGRKRRNQRKDVHTEEMSNPLNQCMSVNVNVPHHDNDINSVGNYAEKKMDESTSCGSKHTKGDITRLQNMIASCDLSSRSMHKNCQASALAGKDVYTGEGAKFPTSSCSETESIETKALHSLKEMDSLERETSSQKSSTENHVDYGGLANVAPCRVMLHPRAVPDVTLMQVNLSLPCSTQYPTTEKSKNDGFDTLRLVSSACKISDSSGVMVLNGFAIKKSVGVFSEGKWRTPDEKSAFSAIRRTASNINQVVTEPQCSAKQLQTRVSASASQLKFARMVFDSAADASFRNRTDEMREKLSCASKLDPHRMYVNKHFDFYSEEEKPPLIGLQCSGMTRDTSVEMIASRICEVKVKQEEGMTEEESFESSLVRKNQDREVGNIQCGVIDRQRSASLSDLPWVTTTGRGPNGKTINGVMYISSGRCVRLVCRCHGKHMSPAEFVEHSGSTDLSNPLRNIVVNPFPLFNQLATMPV